jgi:hypothetical protein
MRKRTIFPFLLVFLGIFAYGLTQCDTDRQDERFKLKSISLWSDTSGIDPYMLRTSLERINKTIDSIGYPGAGYRLWVVTEDSLEFRFMIEGLWPDQESYDKINDDERYKNAIENYMDDTEEQLWNSLDMKWFSMFSSVRDDDGMD